MKDKGLQLEEIEAYHTLGGSGEGRVQGRGKWSGHSTNDQRTTIKLRELVP
jgi:hypothetical protein